MTQIPKEMFKASVQQQFLIWHLHPMSSIAEDPLMHGHIAGPAQPPKPLLKVAICQQHVRDQD